MARAVIVLLSAVVGCADAADATCDLEALVPGLEEVVAAPRAALLAEVLALECGDGVAAPAALYDALAADLALVFAADARMRLDGTEGYALSSALVGPAVLFAWDEAVAVAQVRLERACVQRVTEALGGTVIASTSPLGDARLRIEFASRLHVGVVAAVYATLGIELQPASVVGDGSHVFFRDVGGARELLFEIGEGDCPSGCTRRTWVWWRVADGAATKLGEWSQGFDGEPNVAAPAEFVFDGFACRKCSNGRATRAVSETRCDDGVDDDCDAATDCADDDCAGDAACQAEICDNGGDDDGDGAIDCADDGCATALACGAASPCNAPRDRELTDAWVADNLVQSIDRNAQACEQQRGGAELCMLGFFDANGISAQCGACLTEAAMCMLEQCPTIGVSQEQHDGCILAQCTGLATACLPR